MNPEKKDKTPPKRYYRKRVHLLRLIEKIKLWPSRKGILHGIRSIEKLGEQARIITHCNKEFLINNSKSSRAARWLRNKLYFGVCPQCGVPEWKLEKYDSTRFKRHQGSLLLNDQEKGTDSAES
ncbi:MAG: pyrrolysine--tRNA(Pyl) ligase small subunit [Planctomycetota bacterium]